MPTRFRERRLLARYGASASSDVGTIDTIDMPDTAEQQALASRRAKIQGVIRSYVQVTFHELGVAGAAQTRELISSVKAIELDDRALTMWEEGLDWYGKAQNAARQLVAEMKAKLQKAEAENVLGPASSAEWMRWLRRPDIDYKTKENRVKSFDGWLSKLKAICTSRNTLAALPRVKALPKEKVPKIADFLDPKKFRDLKMGEQKSLIAQVRAALASKEENRDSVYDDAKQALEAAVAGGYLHPDKLGRWLQRAMAHAKPDAYVAATLPVFLANWKGIRQEFDDVELRLRRQGAPRYFQPVPATTFLSWTFSKCKTYLAYANSQLTQAATESKEEASALRNYKMLARHDLSTRDWDGAERTITAARKAFPDDAELLSLQQFLASHRTDTDEDRTKQAERPPEEVKKEVDTTIAQLPIAVRDMTIACANDSPDAVRALGGMFYNRCWAKRKGYSNEAQEMRDAADEKIKRETEQRMREGHGKELEKNRLAGSTEDDLAVNDAPANAQVLYPKSGARAQSVVAEAAKRNKTNGSFVYWTSVVPDGMSYAQHEYLVQNTFPALKRNLRSLEDKGVKYSFGGAAPAATTENAQQKSTLAAAPANQAPSSAPKAMAA